MKNNVLNLLYAAADAEYKDFNSSLIPNIAMEKFIGVRTPILRKIAKDIIKSGFAMDFINDLPHQYFEENQIHAFVLSALPDFDIVIKETERFLPYVDNWATCDQMSPMVFKKNNDLLLIYINKWIKSKHVYTVRFGVLCLMRYFLDDGFDSKYIDMVANIKSNEYYVNMMRAWYFATGLAKHFEEFLPYLQNGKIDDWTRKRAIQKALESFRVCSKNKEILRKIR